MIWSSLITFSTCQHLKNPRLVIRKCLAFLNLQELDSLELDS